MSERLLEVETVSVNGETRNIYVPCGRYYHSERFYELNLLCLDTINLL
jgi:hypothetical protein